MEEYFFPIFIGLLYGLFLDFVFMRSFQIVENKINNSLEGILSTIVACLITGSLLLTVLFFQPYIENWKLFIPIWFMGLLAGALLSKITDVGNDK